MTTFAVMMCKDESDIILDTVTHLLGQVDHVIVSDNNSTDGTREILADLPVQLLDDPDPAYHQSAKMSRLAAIAASQGADFVIPCDADELWYHSDTTIAEFLKEIPKDRALVKAALYDHVATYADPEGLSPVRTLGYRRTEPGRLPKVAVRASLPVTIHMGNHWANYDTPMDPVGGLIIRHYPYRSVKQMVRKIDNGWKGLQAAPELLETDGAHWRQYGALELANPGAIDEIFYQWFWSADPQNDPALVYDPFRLD